MSLEALKERVLEKARAEAERILSEARERASKIVDEARREYLQRREEARRRELAELASEYSRRLTARSMELNTELLRVKNQIVSDLLESVKARLGEVSGDLRRESLKRLLSEALAQGMDVGEAVIRVLPRDAELLHEILREVGNPVAVKKVDILPESCLGGVVVESAEGAFAVDNTYLTRLERLSAFIYKRLREEVFKW